MKNKFPKYKKQSLCAKFLKNKKYNSKTGILNSVLVKKMSSIEPDKRKYKWENKKEGTTKKPISYAST